MIDHKLIGCLIRADAPNRRTRRGVLLPPKSPRFRHRLTVDGKPPIPFNPDGWTITVLAGPLYRHSELPAEHLATRTMLKTELRRQPAPGQKPVAEYKLRKGTADLFAVADTEPMAALSPARAASWTAMRTCQRCGKERPRPIPEQDGVRNCSDCRKTLAFECWKEQSRRAQAEAAAWAREVLDDPAAVLVARSKGWDITRYRAETVAGEPLLDERVRGIDNVDDDSPYFSTPADPEQAAEMIVARRAKYDGTISKTHLAHLAPAFTDFRLIGWYQQCATGNVGIGHINSDDVLSERLALWSGVAPANGAPYWYPEPRMPWSYHPPTFVPYNTHRSLDEDNLPARISNLRTLLHLMAHSTPPEPSVHRPFGSAP